MGITGCIRSGNEFEIGEKSNIEISEGTISLSIKSGSLSQTRTTLLLTNNSNMDIQYGDYYEIEIKKDDEWYKIKVVLEFNLPLYTLNSDQTAEIEVDWENGYGKLSNGTYRIIKNIKYENEDGTAEEYYVAAEFTIDE